MELSQATVQRNVADEIMDRGVVGIGTVAFGGVGGLFLAQEASDLVLPQLGMPVDPSKPSELAASAAVKLVGAAALVAVAMRVGGDMATGLSGSLAAGMLISMGLDVFDIFQRGGVPGMSPSPSAGAPAAPSPNPSPSPQPGPTIQPASTDSSGSIRPEVTGGYR